MAIEVKKIIELTELTAFTTDTLFVVHDGQGACKATMQQLWDYLPNLTTKYYHSESGVTGGNYSGAGAHNGIYRGACINALSASGTIIKTPGNMVTEAQYDAIDSGDFTDMYIGDFWQCTDGSSTYDYRIAAFDYYYGCGDGGSGMYYDFKYGATKYDGKDDHDAHVVVNTNVTKHHIVVVPDQVLATKKSFSAAFDDSNAGYGNCYLRRGTLFMKSGTKYYSDAECTIEKGTLTKDTECYTCNIWSTGSDVEGTAISGYTGTLRSSMGYYKVEDSKVGTGEGMEAYWKESVGGMYEVRSKLIKHFGLNHLLCHRVLLVSAIEPGIPLTGGWYSTICELPNEVQMYGTYIHASMNSNNVKHMKNTVDTTQLSLFRFRPDLIISNSDFWLQDIPTNHFIASDKAAIYVRHTGLILNEDQHWDNSIRPVFCIVKSND